METLERIVLNDVTYIPEGEQPTPVTGDYVIVRARDAGVHVGRETSRNTMAVTIHLQNAVRIHRWRGANTLNEIALHGVESAKESSYTRVSEPVADITILGICEIIPCSDEVAKGIRDAGWAD
jgi:hypothetical protein|tara:strand:- start:769 stop:1137 length:369 start_codon:yes stop_codon:yes gene_type:complete